MINTSDVQGEMLKAAKWSVFAEMAAKLVTPFTSMILARILAPEEFGIIATITILTSLADLIADAGFQKYIIQHKFDSPEELHQYASSAFWATLSVSFIVWFTISALSKPIAAILGARGYELAIIVASSKLLISSFTGVQRAIYQRALNYKKLFFVRITVALIPLFITIPLAIIGLGYWSLIITTLVNEIAYAVILMLQSEWKPNLYFRFKQFKQMLSFSVWSLVEQFTIWLATYADTFIISRFLNEYYMGIFKQPYQLINNIYSVITASIFTILFSALSRFNDNNDEEGYKDILLSTQKILALLIMPMGVGIFIYRHLATNILLGSQWYDAEIVIGAFALEKIVQLIINNSASEVYRSKGKPKVSVIAEVSFLIVLVPLCLWGLQFGFKTFVIVRATASILFAIIHAMLLFHFFRISVSEMLINLRSPAIATLLMGVVAYGLRQLAYREIWKECLWIFMCVILYVFLICNMLDTKKILCELETKYLNRSGKMRYYISKAFYFLCNPLRLMIFLLVHFGKHLPDKQYLSIMYQLRIGRKLNWKDPKGFNAKLQWLKIHEHYPERSKLVDKYDVREYVAKTIGEEYLIPLLGVWNHFSEIDFDLLPKQFVLKCTHDSGGVVICRDKANFDKVMALRRIERHLDCNFFQNGREYPYKHVVPRIIAEQYMEAADGTDLKDYKLMCFHGKVCCSFVCTNRNTAQGLCVNFYDRNWEPMPFERHYPRNLVETEKPQQYDTMLWLAETLSKDFVFVRIDFYEIDQKVYFGEITFYPGSGMEEFTPYEYDELLGSWIELPKGNLQ